MKTVSATDARKRWFELIEQAGKAGVVITIQHRDLPDVVLMSVEEFEGWQETLEIMSDSQLMKDIREAMQEKKVIPLEKLETARHPTIRSVQSRSQERGGKTVRKSFGKR